MTVIGVYPRRQETARDRISAVCTRLSLGKPQWRTGADAGQLFLAVLTEAIDIVRDRARRVIIVAEFARVVAPRSVDPAAADFSDTEWRYSWRAYLEARGIGFVAVEGELPPVEMSARASVIRSYQRATVALAKAVEARMTAKQRTPGKAGYVCGRPPYGYHVTDGRFEVDEQQAQIVRRMFELVLGGATCSEVIKAVGGRMIIKVKPQPVNKGKSKAKRKKRRKPPKLREEYWDRKKIHRIIERYKLYCQGVYLLKNGTEAVMPNLAFLPKSWAEKMEQYLAQARKRPEAVPSPKRTGTMDGQSATLGALS